MRTHAPPHPAHRDEPTATAEAPDQALDVEESIDVLLRDLRTSREGLSSADAQRRVQQYGPNELQQREGTRWPGEVAAQLTQPLALLLWVAAALEFAIGNNTIGIAVVLVVLINATMALFQERQAARAVEALSAYLPERTTAMRDGHPGVVDAYELVPGDVILLEEGERVPAEAAHGNSLRALVKHLDGISDEDIAALNLPTGIPLVYELDHDFRVLTPGGRYLDPEAAAESAQAVAQQGARG